MCPGMADTPMIDGQREAFAAANFPLLAPEDVADGDVAGGDERRDGRSWFIQPGRETAPFRFPNLPGPRVEGEPVGAPPLP